MYLKAMQDQIHDWQQWTEQPHIYISHIKDIPIPILSLELQNAKVQRFQNMQTKLSGITQELSDCKLEMNEFVASCYH